MRACSDLLAAHFVEYMDFSARDVQPHICVAERRKVANPSPKSQCANADAFFFARCVFVRKVLPVCVFFLCHHRHVCDCECRAPNRLFNALCQQQTATGSGVWNTSPTCSVGNIKLRTCRRQRRPAVSVRNDSFPCALEVAQSYNAHGKKHAAHIWIRPKLALHSRGGKKNALEGMKLIPPNMKRSGKTCKAPCFFVPRKRKRDFLASKCSTCCL